MRRVFVVALVSLTLAACDASNLPPRSLCTGAPSTATISDLAIGTGPAGFRPLADGAATYTETGTDGSTLISLRAGWQGAEAPACGLVTMFVFDPLTGETLVSETLQLDSTPIADWNTSGQLFYDADGWPAEVVVEIRIYGMTLRLTLAVGGWELPDAGP